MAKIKAVRHYDGYVNMLNKFGTPQDNSTAYQYQGDGIIPDMLLSHHYETNGIFTKIIDSPAEEATKYGFDLGFKDTKAGDYINDSLDTLDWEDNATTAIKWARLFGGALAVMLIDDGGGIEEPLDWNNIRSIDEIMVYDRSLVQPDYTRLYNFNNMSFSERSGKKFGRPEYYNVFSMFGSFTVHESRCLSFKNGVLPERTMQTLYRFWGIPEYTRIKKELRENVTSHGLGVKMLERCVQAIYSMKQLSSILASEQGEDEILKRIQAIDTARNILNTVAIDSEGESFDFKSFTLSGVKEILDSTCNMLSAVTNIPQTILFGRSPTGMNATGKSDLENYYNYIQRIQKLMLRRNLQKLIDIIIKCGLSEGKLSEPPQYKLKFNPLWSMSEDEQADIDQKKAQTELINAQTAQIYVGIGAIDPTEVRRGLAAQDKFDIETLLDDMDDEELFDDFISENNENILTKNQKNDIINADSDETKWITVNGTPIPVDDESGKLTGSVGEKIMSSGNNSNENEQNNKKTEQQRKSISGAIVGTKTKDGITVNSISEHAFKRIDERGYGASQIKGTYQLSDSKPSNDDPDNANLYERNGMRVVIDKNTGNIISVIRLDKKGGKKRGKKAH